jgi:hypothetical protein
MAFIADPDAVEAYFAEGHIHDNDLPVILAKTFNISYLPDANETLQYLTALWKKDINMAMDNGLTDIMPYLIKWKASHHEACGGHGECGTLVRMHDSRGNYTMVTINNYDQVPLPILIRERLKEWFKSYYTLHTYSCAGFLYYMMHGKHFPSPKLWQTFPIRDVRNGQSNDRARLSNYVLLTAYHPRPVQEDFHFALFVPELDSYLSQFGNGGRIIIGSLDEMNRFFNTDKVTYISDMTPIYTNER